MKNKIMSILWLIGFLLSVIITGFAEEIGNNDEEQRPEVVSLLYDSFDKGERTIDGENLARLAELLLNNETDWEKADDAIRLLQIMKPNTLTPELREAMLFQLEKGTSRAATVLGELGDSSLIPELKPYLLYGSNREFVNNEVRLALAKLGDKTALNDILSGLDDYESPRIIWTFEDLAYISDISTVPKIAPFLYMSERIPQQSIDVIYPYYQDLAIWTLSEIVPTPPVKKYLGSPATNEEVDSWIDWWEKHQDEYEF